MLSESFGAWVRFAGNEEDALTHATAQFRADTRRRQCVLYFEAWIEHVISCKVMHNVGQRAAQHGAATATLRVWRRILRLHGTYTQLRLAVRVHRARSVRCALRWWQTLVRRRKGGRLVAQGHTRHLLGKSTARWVAVAVVGHRKRAIESGALATKHFRSTMVRAAVGKFVRILFLSS